jgi:hypothetical protein
LKKVPKQNKTDAQLKEQALYEALRPEFEGKLGNLICFKSFARAKECAKTHKCKKNERQFIFGKQGEWKFQDPRPNDPNAQVNPAAISTAGNPADFNYITYFVDANGKETFAYANHYSGKGGESTTYYLRDEPPPCNFPAEIWCVQCIKKKGSSGYCVGENTVQILPLEGRTHREKRAVLRRAGPLPGLAAEIG